MFVKYYLYTTPNNKGYAAIWVGAENSGDGFMLSECQWIVPGTVDND